MKVLKFGGPAISGAQSMKAVAGIAAGAGKNIVVLAAIEGTTDALAEVAAQLYARNVEAARKGLAALEKQYLALVDELYAGAGSKARASGFVRDVFASLADYTKDLFGSVEERVMLAQGELLSTFLFATLLEERGVKAAIVPALSYLKLDAHANPDAEGIKGALSKLLAQEPEAELYLTQGYICVNARGEVDNLGRGGSDITASLVGAAIGAEEIQIWTAETRQDRPAHLHFEEAAELAYFGAQLIHPTCILPARDANIPVRVLNSLAPEAPGTLIDNKLDAGVIKAVAAKDGIVAIKIKSSRMLLACGFLRKVFEIFESYRTPIDMICTSEVGVSLTIDDKSFLDEIVRDLEKYGTVTVDRGMCIICVAGDMDWRNCGLESRVMGALKDIPVRMVSYGGSNYNISILVRGEDKASALESLDKQLFGR
ncbi:MAG: aspartate kinase [Bacteroidales bacterium]|nr:aspartate kinase [Bacteroidales bacterium]